MRLEKKSKDMATRMHKGANCLVSLEARLQLSRQKAICTADGTRVTRKLEGSRGQLLHTMTVVRIQISVAELTYSMRGCLAIFMR